MTATEVGLAVAAATLLMTLLGIVWKGAVIAGEMHAGLAELRGLYCTKYRPADGIEAVCSIQGYTPAEVDERAERDFFAEEQRAAELRLTEYKREFAALPPAEQQENQRLLAAAGAVQLRRA